MLAVSGTRLFAGEQTRSDRAQFYVNEYAKFLAAWQESQFHYSAQASVSTETEGLTAKVKSQGVVGVSAARRSLHYTWAGTATWSRERGDVSWDQGATEILVTPIQMMTVGSAQQGGSPEEKFVSVAVKHRVATDDWANELRQQDLTLFLGFVPQGGPQTNALLQVSLLDMIRSAKLEDLREQRGPSPELVGFLAKANHFHIRALFDPSNNHMLRKFEFLRPADQVGSFGLIKSSFEILEAGYKNQVPSFVKLKTNFQSAGGVIDRSTLAENAVLTPSQKASTHITYPSRSHENVYEISQIRHQEDLAAPWFKLTTAIPNGTVVDIDGKPQDAYYWQDSQIKRGIPPVPESEVQEAIEDAFSRPQSPIKRFRAVQPKLQALNQHGLIVFADPQHPQTSALYHACVENSEIVRKLSDYVTIGVSTLNEHRVAAQELAEFAGVKISDGGALVLIITDAKGQLLGQLQGKDLQGDDEKALDLTKVQDFLEQHSPPTIDARKLFAEAMEQARRDNKRVLVQQTATWCGPCWMLTEFLNSQRGVWDKDYLWIKIDERWTHADEVLKPIRKNDAGGIPWIAILDAKGKVLATSDQSNGENIGFPSHNEPAGIQHFMKMLKSTRQRMTKEDLDTLQKALEKE